MTNNYETFYCSCGGRYNKYNQKKHNNSNKHKRHVGELPPLKKKIPKIIDPNGLSYIINNKVENLNEEQLARRREYFRHRVAECRQRKKDSLP